MKGRTAMLRGWSVVVLVAVCATMACNHERSAWRDRHCCQGGDGAALFGPYGRDGATLFAQLRGALEMNGYVVEETDEANGRIRTTAHYTRHSRGASITTMLQLQVYRSGWVEILPSGELVRPQDIGTFDAPNEIDDEMSSLALNVMSLLGRPQQVSARLAQNLGFYFNQVAALSDDTAVAGDRPASWPELPAGRLEAAHAMPVEAVPPR